MRKPLFARLAVVAVAAVLAGCNGYGAPSAGPTLGPTCVLPAGTQSALVYPASGATGVVDSNGEVVIGSTTALPSNWQIVIVDGNNPGGAGLPALQTAAPPFPSPNQTPSFANPQYQSATAGVAVGAGQTVGVFLNDTAASNNCAPLEIGSFST